MKKRLMAVFWGCRKMEIERSGWVHFKISLVIFTPDPLKGNLNPFIRRFRFPFRGQG